MNLNESYDCQMPCTSTTPFFPPISSITQSFSSGKSDIDLLQVIAHILSVKKIFVLYLLSIKAKFVQYNLHFNCYDCKPA